jgi:hypothetical protein
MTFTTERDPIGYASIYRQRDGNVIVASGPLLKTLDDAKRSAPRCDGNGLEHLGIAAIILLTASDT